MKKYRVIGIVKSKAILPINQICNLDISTTYGNTKVIIENMPSHDELDRPIINGLRVSCEVQCKEWTNSIPLSKLFVQMILDIIGFSSLDVVEEFRPDEIFEIDSSNDVTEYVHIDYDIVESIFSSIIDTKRLDLIFNRVQNKGKYNDRIIRALHWFNKALREKEDIVDSFLYLWLSLESLNPILQEIYPDQEEIQRCEKCGYERKFKSTASVKAAFEEKDQRGLYSKARDIRSSLQHGFKDIPSITNDLVEIIDQLYETCAAIIFKCMDIKETEIEVYSNLIPIMGIFYMKLSNFTTDTNNKKYFVPFFNINIKMEKANEEILIKPIINTDVLSHGCGIAGLGYRIEGDTGYNIKKLQIEIRDDGKRGLRDTLEGEKRDRGTDK